MNWNPWFLIGKGEPKLRILKASEETDSDDNETDPETDQSRSGKDDCHVSEPNPWKNRGAGAR